MAKELVVDGFTSQEQMLLEPIALKLVQGLLDAHFGRRKPGRPRRNSEMPRLMRAFRKMIRASGTQLEKDEQQVLFRHLINRGLF